MSGRLLSVNVGMPKDVPWQGKTVFTGVFKSPVSGPRRVRKLNVDGDGQGDLAGHGGEQRAVFVYQIDSYRYWENELGRSDFVHGQFGENFTVEGLSDDEVCIGDRYRIGGALFEVTQPRVTCYRVGIRLNDPRIPALLVSHRRPGFYFRVLEEGEVQAGDEIVKVASGAGADDGRRGRRAALPPRAPAAAAAPSAPHRRAQPRLAGVVPRPARRRARRRQCRPGGHEPASGLARLSPAGRRRDRARERLRDLHPPRGPRRRNAACGTPWPVPHAADPARERSATGAPELLAVGTARRRLLPHHRQAGGRRHRQRLSPHPARRRRPGRHRGAPWHLHPRRDARARPADQRGHRRDAGPRDGSRIGGGAFRSRDLVAARRAQQTRTLLRHRGAHAPCLAPERPYPRLLQPSRFGRPRRP